MGRLMASATQTRDMLGAVGRQQARLVPQMRDDPRPLGATVLAGKPVPGQGVRAGPTPTRRVVRVETDMKGHPEQRPCGHALAREEQQHQQHRRAVEQACLAVLRRLHLVEEAHGGQGIQTPLLQTEPQVMVDVDEDTGRPGAQHCPTQPGIEEHGPRGRERNMIANAHGYLPIMPRAASRLGGR